MALDELSLEGRVALVTGANHGIGAATAVALAQRGADVVVTYLRSEMSDRGDDYQRARALDGSSTASAVEVMGRRCVAIEADLADPVVPSHLFDVAEDRLGPVSVLVHNASGWRPDSFADGAVDAVGRTTLPVTRASIDGPYEVEHACRRIADGRVHPATSAAWRLVGSDRDAHLGRWARLSG